MYAGFFVLGGKLDDRTMGDSMLLPVSGYPICSRALCRRLIRSPHAQGEVSMYLVGICILLYDIVDQISKGDPGTTRLDIDQKIKCRNNLKG